MSNEGYYPADVIVNLKHRLKKCQRAHKEVMQAIHERLIVVEHFMDHAMPTGLCKTCDSARRSLREAVMASRG